MVENEGYIKFIAHWNNETFPVDAALINEINLVRSNLMARGWIGVLPDGVGYGNISVRVGSSEKFIITGSATGGYPILEAKHFALVEKFSISGNQLWCTGETIASSESLTHATAYISNPEINAVIHIHSHDLWKKYLDKLPTSDQNAAYGTPEMANSISALFKINPINSGIFIMGGHEDGLISFGQNFSQLSELLIQLYKA